MSKDQTLIEKQANYKNRSLVENSKQVENLKFLASRIDSTSQSAFMTSQKISRNHSNFSTHQNEMEGDL